MENGESEVSCSVTGATITSCFGESGCNKKQASCAAHHVRARGHTSLYSFQDGGNTIVV